MGKEKDGDKQPARKLKPGHILVEDLLFEVLEEDIVPSTPNWGSDDDGKS